MGWGGCIARSVAGITQWWIYAVLHKYGPLLFHPSYSQFSRILRGTRPIKQQATTTTTYRVCVSCVRVCNISPIDRDPAMREKIPESTFWGFYI
jgi:hypothetical protein